MPIPIAELQKAAEPLTDAVVERHRLATGVGALALWRLVCETPPQTRSLRDLIEEQYERSR